MYNTRKLVEFINNNKNKLKSKIIFIFHFNSNGGYILLCSFISNDYIFFINPKNIFLKSPNANIFKFFLIIYFF